MGVYIKGMEMPDNCNECAFINHSWGFDYYCPIAQDYSDYIHILEQRMKGCQLIKIPEPHGDTKDINHINQVLDRFSGYLDDDMIYRLKIAIGRDAPTIIPAEERET